MKDDSATWLEKTKAAARGGDASAARALGLALLHGRRIVGEIQDAPGSVVFRKNRRDGIRWLETAARRGHPEALGDLACALAGHRPDPANMPRILALFDKAARQGSRTAGVNAALCCCKTGWTEEARRRFDAACRRRKKDVFRPLVERGLCRLLGLGGPVNRRGALADFRAAASDSGLPDSERERARGFLAAVRAGLPVSLPPGMSVGDLQPPGGRNP